MSILLTKLIQLRRDRRLHQKDVAKAVGITTSYYGMIELRKRNPNLILAKKIASFFGVAVEDIFFDEPYNKTLDCKCSLPTGTDL
jgi:putative transcriptional regulator